VPILGGAAGGTGLLVETAALARDVRRGCARERRERACSQQHRRARVLAQTLGGARVLGARTGAIDPDGRLGGVRGRRCAHRRYIV